MLRRADGRRLTILSNDLQRTAGEIAALYRKRWQIELLFRWIKQHLKIHAFLGRSENAIRLQLFAAMIAYLLLRIAARDSRSRLLALRFADLVRARLFERRPLGGARSVRLTNELAAEAGLDRHRKSRLLRQLEIYGIVKVTRHGKHNPEVVVIWPMPPVMP